MRLIFALVVANLSMLIAAAAQNEAPKPRVSSEPLTAEQIAVYRAVIKDYLKGSKGPLKVANKTYPLDLSRPFVKRPCIDGVAPKSVDKSITLIHQLDPAVGLNLGIVLVDNKKQLERINENLAAANRPGVTDKQFRQALDQSYKDGVLSLSEVIYDEGHRQAVVAYGFYCGPLCGQGSVLLLKKVGQGWVVSKACGGWIS